MSITDRLTAATAAFDPPLAALDRAALDANAADLTRRAAGLPIRVAAKSVRCRWVLEQVLATSGFAGVMAYSPAEANWLVRTGQRDVLVGYPTVDRSALAELGADPELLAAITLMVDDPGQLDVLAAVLPAPAAPLRLCVDVDASLRIGRLHLGVRRSPLRTPEQAAELARLIADAPHRYRLVGLMFYEAQIAGLPDTSPAVRWMKRRSAAELADRRGAVAAAVRATGAVLEFVNSGGSGSLDVSGADPVVTELTAGSGLYAPTLFDGYRAFRPQPALFLALPVVRRPGPGLVTAFGGGYIASGPAGRSRLPRPVDPARRLIRTEGAGEVQTPLRGTDAAIGDRVWLRPAKAGEVLERFDRLYVLEGDRPAFDVPTYRGEGRNFG